MIIKHRQSQKEHKQPCNIRHTPQEQYVPNQCSCSKSNYIKLISKEGQTDAADNDSIPRTPDWFDERLYKRGKQFFHKNFLSVFVCHLIGLILILAEEKILRVLIHTRKSSTPFTAFKRYLSTLTNVRLWYYSDLLQQNDRGFKSISKIRKIHKNSSKSAQESGLEAPSQYDMVVTQWAFVAPVVLYTHQVGISDDPQGLEGFIHYWRLVGFLLGIDDKFNLCSGNPETVREKSLAILHTVLRPALYDPPEGFLKMRSALLEGTNMITPVCHPVGFLAFTYDLVGGPMDVNSLPKNARKMFQLKVNILGHAVHWPILGIMLRCLINNLLALNLFILNILPFFQKWKSYISSGINSFKKSIYLWWTNAMKYILAILYLPKNWFSD